MSREASVSPPAAASVPQHGPPTVSSETAGGSDRPLVYPLCGMLLLFLALLIRTAWMGDDAFIGTRTIDNFVNGYGLRWNVSERVQVFTHPLWIFIVSFFYYFTREPFITTMVLNIVAAFTAVVLVVRRVASSNAAAIAALAVLVSSKAFIDYSTSGLENAVGYLLVALFCLVLFRSGPAVRQIQWLVLIASLSGFNRLDSVLMFAPAIAYTAWVLWRSGGVTLLRLFRIAFLYSLPLWGWLIFATIYYGFTFPNTYYAKLYTRLPKNELLVQGLLYYVNSLIADPVTLVAIGLALAAGFLAGRGTMRACAAGISLYLLYTINIGGDFMAGRFFSVPLFFAVIMLSQRALPRGVWIGLAVFFAAVGLLTRKPVLFSDDFYGHDIRWNQTAEPAHLTHVNDRRGISDERAAFFQGSGLVTSVNHSRYAPTNDWAVEGRKARRRGPHMVAFQTPGFYGYYAGPDVHILDTYALGDPLLSKLPIWERHDWRVGHYRRGVPVGYIETIQTGENQIVDAKIRELYRVTKVLTQDPIWSVPRFTEILKMNFGFYKPLIKSIKLVNVTAPPGPLTTYLWAPRGDTLGEDEEIFVQVTAGWGREETEHGGFWWSSTSARLAFLLPAGHESAELIIPVYVVAENVALRFYLNGARVEPENAGTQPGGPANTMIMMKLRGPWKAGRNVVEIIGSGEPVVASPPDTRPLLFAVGDLRRVTTSAAVPAEQAKNPGAAAANPR